MTHSPADQQYREKQAGALQIGDYLFLPGMVPRRKSRTSSSNTTILACPHSLW